MKIEMKVCLSTLFQPSQNGANYFQISFLRSINREKTCTFWFLVNFRSHILLICVSDWYCWVLHCCSREKLLQRWEEHVNHTSEKKFKQKKLKSKDKHLLVLLLSLVLKSFEPLIRNRNKFTWGTLWTFLFDL